MPLEARSGYGDVTVAGLVLGLLGDTTRVPLIGVLRFGEKRGSAKTSEVTATPSSPLFATPLREEAGSTSVRDRPEARGR